MHIIALNFKQLRNKKKKFFLIKLKLISGKSSSSASSFEMSAFASNKWLCV